MINRRRFIRTGAVSIAGFSIAKKAKASSPSSFEPSKDVLTRKLGNTGIDVPVLSMGVGRCDSPAVVKAALKLGVTHFDTAHVYQKGNSEKMLGEVLKDYDRNSFSIATKVKTCDTKEKFLELLDISLERLQMKYVDILYLHAINSREGTLNPVMLEALKEAQESGRTKNVGVSTHKNEPEVIQAAIDSNLYNVVLTSVNFKQEHINELKDKIDLAAKSGIGIVAMKVMAGGYLDKLKSKPVNHVAALKWSLQNENVHTTIPSLNNMEQLMENSAILHDLKMSEKEIGDLASASIEQGLYCNACEQCIPTCKKQLPIPELMRAYMYTYGYSEALKAKDLLSSLDFDENLCSDCNICTASCAKGFNLSERIHDISRLNNMPSEFLT